jgi:hypothetical protein
MPKFSLIREWAKDAASDALSLVDNDLLRYHTMTATTARRVSWELPWQGIPICVGQRNHGSCAWFDLSWPDLQLFQP